MDQKQKMIALLASAGILAGSAVSYILFYDKTITKEVAYQIESASGTTSTGSVVATDMTIAYASIVEGTVKLNRHGNEAVLKQNDTLEGGDVISTNTGASIEIIFTDNSFLRLAENSKMTLSGTNSVDLENGGLWARILKPFQDTSVFTINASDLSAGVRGTALYVYRSDNEASVRVIDTTTGTGTAVDVRAETASGTVQEGLKNEESLTIKNNEPEKTRLNMDQMLQNDFVRANLKRDIILMHSMTLNNTTGSGAAPVTMEQINREQMEKIMQEIMVSLPKNNELNKFFQSNVIENEARQLPIFSRALSGSTQLTQEQQIQLLITFTTDDMELNQLQKNLKQMRSASNDFTDDAQKQEYQKQVNQLEQNIREFDANWAKKERARIEQAKLDAAKIMEQTQKPEGEAPVTQSGAVTESGSIDAKGIKVPNVGVKDSPETTKPAVPGTPIPGTPTPIAKPSATTPPTPTTTPANPVVSGPAKPVSNLPKPATTTPNPSSIVSGMASPR